MKNSWRILTLLLAATLLLATIKDIRLSLELNSKGVAPEATQVGLDLIMTRTSVRSFTEAPLNDSQIETLLKAGMAAPSAGNRQPWQMVVVTERELLDSIPGIIPGAHMAAKAQSAIVVCGEPERALMPEYWVQDCSAASQNILLAAHAMGLGAVWCGAYPNNSVDRVGRISSLLQLPEGTLPLSIIVVGNTTAEQHIKDKWDTGKVHYNAF